MNIQLKKIIIYLSLDYKYLHWNYIEFRCLVSVIEKFYQETENRRVFSFDKGKTLDFLSHI